jgi:hypothetical protein
MLLPTNMAKEIIKQELCNLDVTDQDSITRLRNICPFDGEWQILIDLLVAHINTERGDAHNC